MRVPQIFYHKSTTKFTKSCIPQAATLQQVVCNKHQCQLSFPSLRGR